MLRNSSPKSPSLKKRWGLFVHELAFLPFSSQEKGSGDEFKRRLASANRIQRCTISLLQSFSLLAFILLCASSPLFAQIDMAAVARLHFRVAEDSAQWREGFAERVSGTLAPYASHRSNGAAVPALVARTNSSEAVIEWRTAALAATRGNESANFMWACGFGNNLGDEKFQLTANGKYVFTFSTSSAPAWQVLGKPEGALSFTAVHVNHNGAYFGYMTLTLPSEKLARGKPVLVQVSGGQAQKETWYRTFEYRDALSFFLKEEHKEVFSALEYWNLGEAMVHAFAAPQHAGKNVALRRKEESLGASTLLARDGLAVAEISLPRERQTQSFDEIVLALADQPVDTIALHAINEKRLKAFLEEELIVERFVFPPGKLPAVQWRRPGMVDNELGKFPLRVTYYDHNLQRVENAAAPGRYGAVIEATTPAGFKLKRYVTLYCAPVEFDDYGAEVGLTINPLARYGITPSRWQRYEQEFRRFSFGDLIHHPANSADAAIFLAGLAEIDSINKSFDTPRLRDRQWWITFKRKQEGLHERALFMPPAKRNAGKAPELKTTPVATATFTAAEQQRIREICAEWARAANEPLVTLVAHRGQIVFHEAFGTQRDGKPMTRDTPTWMASITKLLTGVLMLQFVEQGLVDLDAPLQNYLLELQSASLSQLTLRHLFTHTHGGAWHGEWGSDWNPALENYLAQAAPYLNVGATFQYNRLGYALAGKVIERLSGRAVPYLFDACLFQPLGMKHAIADNTYGSLYATTLDLAKLGQMLLQRGSYGEHHFFSAENFPKLLPNELKRINPKLEKRWGLGTAPLAGHGLSEQTFGHEAASGAIFRIDPAQELIIVVGRDHTGPNYEDYAARLLEACTAPVQRKGKN